MKELAYGASHEINNPLANISARAQTLLRDETDPERRRALEAIHQQALRAHEMIADLMLFARPPRLERAAVDVPAAGRQGVAELAPECRRREIELQRRADADLPAVLADEVQLAVAVKALCTNSIEAIGREGRINVRRVRSRPTDRSLRDRRPRQRARHLRRRFGRIFSIHFSPVARRGGGWDLACRSAGES